MSGTAGASAARGERSRRTLLALLLLALVVRLGALWAAQGAELVKDERAYLARAEALLDGRGYLGSYQSWVRHDGWKIAELPQYPGAYQPPGYPTFAAAALWLAGGRPLGIQLAQVLLGVAATGLLYGLGRRWFCERAGLAAALLHATYPTLVAFTHYLWSEVFFIALLLTALWLLLRTPSLPSWRDAAFGGVVLGVGALTRSAMLPMIPLLAFWPALRVALAPLPGPESGSQHRSRMRSLRPALVRAALVCAVAAAVIAPWSIRSSRLHGGFVLIDTNGAYNLWRGNERHTFIGRGDPRMVNYSPPFDSIPLHPVANLNAVILLDDLRRERGTRFPTDLEVVDYASTVAWRTIAGDPAAFVRRGWTKLVDMWNPTSFLLRHFELGAYGDVSPGWRALITWSHVVAYLAVMALALSGAVLRWRDPHTWLVALVAGNLSAASVLAFGLTRFRLPVMPLLMLLAGVALARLLPSAPGSDRRARAPNGDFSG